MATSSPSSDPNRDRPAAQSTAQPDRTEKAADPSATASAKDRFEEAARTRQGEDEQPETDIWQGGFSSRAMFGNWLMAAVVTVVALVAVMMVGAANPIAWLAWLAVSALLWGGFGCLLAYRKLTCKYRLTTQRFIHESGLLKRVTDRIEVIDIDDVSCEQQVIERVVGVGTIKILSSDRSHPVLVMRGIEKVKEVASLIDDLRRKERRRRGLHIEAI